MGLICLSALWLMAQWHIQMLSISLENGANVSTVVNVTLTKRSWQHISVKTVGMVLDLSARIVVLKLGERETCCDTYVNFTNDKSFQFCGEV